MRVSLITGAVLALAAAGACGGGAQPTAAPTGVPTAAPTAAPTGASTATPTGAPTAAPTGAPTAAPTGAPTSVAACGSTATSGEEVVIRSFKYTPAEITVSAGTTVAWTNTDGASHTVTFDDGPDCGTLSQGAAVAREFDTAGTFSYFCRFHPSMEGTVVVQ